MALRRSAGPSIQALCALPELYRASAVLRQPTWQQLPAYRLFSSEVPAPGDRAVTEYRGPFGQAVGRVKRLSLFSCACALAAGPIIFGLDAGGTLTAKASIAGTLATFGVFTTGLLQWFTGPYVQRLTYRSDIDSVEVMTLNLLAQPRTVRFHVAEARPADTVHPLSSFSVGGKIYYLDADNFPDKALLARLAPQQAAEQAVSEADEQREQLAEGAQQQQQQQGPAAGSVCGQKAP